MMKANTLLVVLTSLFFFQSHAQDTWNWGDNPKEAKGNYMYLKTLVDAEEYNKAATPTKWLLTHAPNLDLALYQLAGTVYQNKLRDEKDRDKKDILTDSLIAIYDKRIALYGNEAYVLNLKGLVAWPHYYKDKTKRDEMYNLYKKIYTLNGKEAYEINLLFYFAAATRELDAKKMTEADILDLYNVLVEDLESRNSKAAEAYKEKLDIELNAHVTVDCDFVQNNYGGKFTTAPTVELAHKIQSLLEKNKCISNDLYITATNYLIAQEGPTYKNLKTLGNIYQNQGKADEAYENYSKSLELAQNDTVKGELYMSLASIDMQKGRKSTARSNIYKAIEKNPSLSAEGHQTIGDLYMTSGNECAKGDALGDRLIYIAAYNEYKKAGNSAKMASAKAQFPSMEDIFVHNKKAGDTMETGCWVGETVTLQKRD